MIALQILKKQFKTTFGNINSSQSRSRENYRESLERENECTDRLREEKTDTK